MNKLQWKTWSNIWPRHTQLMVWTRPEWNSAQNKSHNAPALVLGTNRRLCRRSTSDGRKERPKFPVKHIKKSLWREKSLGHKDTNGKRQQRRTLVMQKQLEKTWTVHLNIALTKIIRRFTTTTDGTTFHSVTHVKMGQHVGEHIFMYTEELHRSVPGSLLSEFSYATKTDAAGLVTSHCLHHEPPRPKVTHNKVRGLWFVGAGGIRLTSRTFFLQINRDQSRVSFQPSQIQDLGFLDDEERVSICYGDLFIQWMLAEPVPLFSAKTKVPVDVSLKTVFHGLSFFLCQRMMKKSAVPTSPTNSFLVPLIQPSPVSEEDRWCASRWDPSRANVRWSRKRRRGWMEWRSEKRPTPSLRLDWRPTAHRQELWPQLDRRETLQLLSPWWRQLLCSQRPLWAGPEVQGCRSGDAVPSLCAGRRSRSSEPRCSRCTSR